jgi:hypothetical protein
VNETQLRCTNPAAGQGRLRHQISHDCVLTLPSLGSPSQGSIHKFLPPAISVDNSLSYHHTHQAPTPCASSMCLLKRWPPKPKP